MADEEGVDLDAILEKFNHEQQLAAGVNQAAFDAVNVTMQQHVKMGEDGLPVVTYTDDGIPDGFEIGEGAGDAAIFSFTGTLLKEYLAQGSSDDQLSTLLDMHKDPNGRLARNTLQGWLGHQGGSAFISTLQDNDNYLSGAAVANIADQLGRTAVQNQGQVLAAQYITPHEDAILARGKALVGEAGYEAEAGFGVGEALQVYQANSPASNSQLYKALAANNAISKK